MGQGELVRYLIRNAESKRHEILARGREEARRIAEEAERRFEAVEREISGASALSAEKERLALENRARMAAGAGRLRARVSHAEAVLARMEERLSLLVGEARYPAVAERLYRELLPEIPEGDVVVRADPRAREALAFLAADPGIRFEPLPEEEIGGVEASCGGGAFLLRNTLRSRFAKARPELLVEIGRRLPDPDE